jgi:uracil DNA glycosylase
MLSHYYKNLVFIMAGGMAQEFIPCIEEPKHTILTCSHPAAADYIGSSWEHQQVFKRCNRILKAKGIKPVAWYTPALQKAEA